MDQTEWLVLVPTAIAPSQATMLLRGSEDEVTLHCRFVHYEGRDRLEHILRDKAGRVALIFADASTVLQKSLACGVYPIGDTPSDDLIIMQERLSNEAQEIYRTIVEGREDLYSMFVNGRHMAVPSLWSLVGTIARGSCLDALRDGNWDRALRKARRVIVVTPAGDPFLPLSVISQSEWPRDFGIVDDKRIAHLRAILLQIAESEVMVVSNLNAELVSSFDPDIIVGVTARQAVRRFGVTFGPAPRPAGTTRGAAASSKRRGYGSPKPIESWLLMMLHAAIPSSVKDVSAARTILRSVLDSEERMSGDALWPPFGKSGPIRGLTTKLLEECPRMVAPRMRSLGSASDRWTGCWREFGLAVARLRRAEQATPSENYWLEVEAELDDALGG